MSVASGQGEPLRVMVLAEDITERKSAEEDLRASEERFRVAAENASDIIYKWDLATGKVTTHGIRPGRFWDHPVPGNIEAFQRMVHPDDRMRVAAALQRQIEHGEPYRCEFRVVGEDGRIYFYADRGVALRNAQGQPYKWVGLVTDITERKTADEAIAQLARDRPVFRGCHHREQSYGTCHKLECRRGKAIRLQHCGSAGQAGDLSFAATATLRRSPGLSRSNPTG